MASLKPLRSVAHNLPHHFASTLNWWEDDYAIHHLARSASGFPGKKVELDVLAGSSHPPVTGVSLRAVVALRETLWRLMVKAGLDPTILTTARIAYDFGVDRHDVAHGLPCYDCVCTLSTNCGRTYQAKLTERNN